MMWCVFGSYLSSLTPSTTVKSGFFAGAVMMTFFAPAARCFAALSRSVKSPVDSNTTSTPRILPRQLRRVLHRQHLELVACRRRCVSPLAVMSAFRLPRIESYLSRCASVVAFVRSLTATKSMLARAERGAHDVAADAAESVDPDLDGHLSPPTRKCPVAPQRAESRPPRQRCTTEKARTKCSCPARSVALRALILVNGLRSSQPQL